MSELTDFIIAMMGIAGWVILLILMSGGDETITAVFAAVLIINGMIVIQGRENKDE